jgi:hypothetical protein
VHKIYAKIATCFPFEFIFSSSVIEIDPFYKEMDNFCIIPGNHTIRIVDFSNNTCDVILKEGFNQKFIKNEIKLRCLFSHSIIPKLIYHDSDNGFYSEEKIEGLPLNRLGNSDDRLKALTISLNCLSELYNKTRKKIQLHDRLSYLDNELSILESDLRYHKTDRLWHLIYEVTSTLRTLILDKENILVPTTITHGDFQSSNILYDSSDGSKTYLIDWEYSSRRFELYDYYVYFYKARFPIGLAHRFRYKDINSNNDISFISEGLLPHFTSNSWEDLLLLFEDILVRASELCIPMSLENNNNFEVFLVETIDWLSHKN